MAAVKFDDLFINMPEDWRGNAQKERFVSILQLLSKRTGGGATDNIDSLQTDYTQLEASVSSNSSNISTNTSNISTNTSDIATLTLKNAILELISFSPERPKKVKDRTKYNTWGVL